MLRVASNITNPQAMATKILRLLFETKHGRFNSVRGT